MLNIDRIILPGKPLSFVLLLILSLFFYSCDKQDDNKPANSVKQPALAQPPAVESIEVPQEENISSQPSWSQHLISHDQGWVQAEQSIKIHFSHAVITEDKLNIPLEGIISVTPDIEIQAQFAALDELILTPKQRLPSGKVFSLSLLPHKLNNLPAALDTYDFQIQVLQQDYELQVSGLIPSEKKNAMTLRGSIHTSDTAEAEDIESTIHLKSKNKTLDITWNHNPNKLDHEFEINNIEREQLGSTVELEYSAKTIGVEKNGVHKIDVPALNKFQVTAVRTIQRPKQYIEVSFSEALDRNQNLNGLVRLKSEDVSVRVDGAALHIYPQAPVSGIAELEIEDTIRSAKNLQLPEIFKREVTFISELPGIRFSSRGSIIPPTESLTVPFEAINVNAVWVTAFKVYENNIQQYLQNFSITTNRIDTRSGRYLWRKKITLPSVPFDKWQRYDIDLNDIMKNHADGIINLQLSIDTSTVAYACPEDGPDSIDEKLQSYDGPNMEDVTDRPDWFYNYYSQNNGYVTYEQRSDPCLPDYYSYYRTQNVKDARNFIVSDIGLIVKKGNSNHLNVIATGIISGEPKRKTKIKLYNYQHQLLAEALTDKNGIASLDSQSAGFYLTAENGNDHNYLRLPRNEALPTSQFDTRGEKVQGGIKGFLYGERDVWRPGDNIYLTFVLQDKENKIPKNHPVSLDFFDPRGSKVTTLVASQPTGDLYTFVLKTDEKSPTGNWRAVARIGGEYFDKIIKIETITPNRLKVEITPDRKPMITSSPVRTEMFAQWLNGATAKNLRADVEIKLSPMKTEFAGWSQFEFDDPASPFKTYSQKVFDANLDANGRAAFNVNLERVKQAPGKLRATFVSRVFEQSGNFSTSIRTQEVVPYDNWVGLFIPDGSGYNGAISRDEDQAIDFIAINSDGKPAVNRKLTLSIFQIGWRWWWDQSEEDLSNYIRSASNKNIVETKLRSGDDGHAHWTLAKNKYSWGRHLIRVCDDESGHCSGKEVYLGWSWNNQVNPDSATQLMLATDKESYEPGDIAHISIPELSQGKILYSLENGSKVLDQKWLDLQPGATTFDVPITPEMAPNVYANVVLLLPHQQRESDAPIRLYGVTPLIVSNPQDHLKPKLETPETVRPESTFEVTVTEEKNRKMSYTLALVDEGLLGITGYQAPDPYNRFYRREALGVLTWDMFDGVIGAYGANLERLLKIGGGEKGNDDKKSKERRFPPVVNFLGAFTIEAGEQKTHSITLPQYIGAVRVMVVAADNGAYGKTEKSITVTQPLSLLATLPRVIGPKEKVSLPVNVFVSNNSIKTVDVSVTTNDLFTINKGKHTFKFTEAGDQIASLELEVMDRIGEGKITVVAQSGDEKAEQTIYLNSRSPNAASTRHEVKFLQPGESWHPSLKPHGMENTNLSKISISSFPSLNLDKRLGYLIRYPHGCIEQTTSSVFPQIALNNIVNLSEQQQNEIQNNVLTAIEKYRNFQNANGGFSYWPGGPYINDWASIYATHFLVEAKQLGYAVPNNMQTDAIKYLRNISDNNAYNYSNLVNAYRLYVLALADSPDLAAMNRLRETLIKTRKYYDDNVARWQLATAYQHLGLNDVANELMAVEANKVTPYNNGNYTYGSNLRDEAILLLSLHVLNDETEAWNHATEIARLLSQDQWYSTHSTAWALLALSKYAEKMSKDGNHFAIAENGNSAHESEIKWQALESVKAIYQQNILPVTLENAALRVRNDSDHPLHIEITNTGIPSAGEEPAQSNGLRMQIDFADIDGNPLDISKIKQGQDFVAEVTVKADNTRNSYKIEDIAMTLAIPSGWQIRNQRLEGETIPDGLDYQDIRDDAVLSYFSLWKDYYWYYRYNDRNRNEQHIKVVLNASFAGKFYLPGWQVKSMYDEDITASNTGQWVEVIAEK